MFTNGLHLEKDDTCGFLIVSRLYCYVFDKFPSMNNLSMHKINNNNMYCWTVGVWKYGNSPVLC